MSATRDGYDSPMTIKPGDFIPTGWFHDGEQALFHDGTGNFYIAGQWYFRPDLLIGMPPPPPTLAERARMEQQRLSTPWPTYHEAWRHAKAEKWLCHRWITRIAPIFTLVVWPIIMIAGAFQPPDYVPQWQMNLILSMIAVWVGFWLSFWRVYHRHLHTVDSHKGRAFGWGSYIAVTGALHALHRRAERQRWAQVSGVVPGPDYLQQATQTLMASENRYNR